MLKFWNLELLERKFYGNGLYILLWNLELLERKFTMVYIYYICTFKFWNLELLERKFK